MGTVSTFHFRQGIIDELYIGSPFLLFNSRVMWVSYRGVIHLLFQHNFVLFLTQPHTQPASQPPTHPEDHVWRRPDTVLIHSAQCAGQVQRTQSCAGCGGIVGCCPEETACDDDDAPAATVWPGTLPGSSDDAAAVCCCCCRCCLAG